MSRNAYLTTPIYYVNDVPHLGHVYTSIVTDIVARFMRMEGRDVFFLTGTDEHGQKNAKAAHARGEDPQDYVDRLSQNFRRMSEQANLSNTDFIRTTEPRHKKAAQALWNKLMDNGWIYLDSYAGWYSVRDEAYFAESEIVDGKAPTGAPVEWIEEPSYFFRLSAFQDRLLNFYKENPNFVVPQSRLNEVVRFVEGGLKDLSISRTTFQWGIPVPGDDKHIMYVWLDALTNYLSALGYPEKTVELEKFWPEARHVVGKDILRFHAVYWPAFLMAADLAPPSQIIAHGWWTVEGQKMSKSLGNAIAPQPLFETYGLDQMRYFLAREVSFGGDGDFSHQAALTRANKDLANDYGNLVQRVLSFIYKNLDGQLPAVTDLLPDDLKLLQKTADRFSVIAKHMETFQLHKACDEIWELIGDGNRYIDTWKPWALKKTNPERMLTVLGVLVILIRRVALLTLAMMPEKVSLILDQLGVPEDERHFGTYLKDDITLSIGEPKGVFPRIEAVV